MFKLSIITLSILISAFSVNAENSSELLRHTLNTVQNRISTQAFNPTGNHLSGLDAWINKSEVNWSNNDFGDFDDQKVSYKVQIKNREQINIEQALLDMGQSRSALKLSSILDAKLQQKYASLVDLIEKEKYQRFLKQKHTLIKSELNNWKLKINSNAFRADKLQQADLALDNVWGEMLENGSILERLRGPTNTVVGKTPSISQMLRTVQNILSTGEYQQYNNRILKAEMDLQIANKQQQRSKAQQKLSLNSFQLEYDHKDEDFGVSVGIKVPVIKNSFDTLQEKQAFHYRNLDAQNVRFEVEDQLIEERNVLHQLKIQWQSSQEVTKKVNTRIKRLSRTGNIDLLMDLKFQRLAVLKRQDKLEIQALRQYISFLKTAGMLSAKPYKNWLLAGIPRL